MKQFSENFEDLGQRGDVINPKYVRERTQVCITCTNGDRKRTIKNKRSFKVRYLFMKLFSQHRKILVPYCDIIISELGHIESPFAQDMQMWVFLTQC